MFIDSQELKDFLENYYDDPININNSCYDLIDTLNDHFDLNISIEKDDFEHTDIDGELLDEQW